MAVLGRIELARRAQCGPVWRTVTAVAGEQHGTVGRWQLLELGLGKSGIQRALHRGLLHSLHAGVYAVGGAPSTLHARLTAAVLAGGEGAMLSHRSAALLLRFIDAGPPRIDVIAPRCGRRPRNGLLIHRPRLLPAEECWIRSGIPLTNASRTLIDLASVFTERQLRDAVHSADRRRVLDIERIELMLEQTRGRRGTARLGVILAAYRPLPTTRSWLQDRFLSACDQAGVSRPASDVVVEGLEVDCLWPHERLIVELDSYGFHGDPDTFESDRRRDVILTLAGYTVLRFTYERVTREPEAVMREVQEALERARRGPHRGR